MEEIIAIFPTNLKLHLEPLVVLSAIIMIVIILTQIEKYYWTGHRVGLLTQI